MAFKFFKGLFSGSRGAHHREAGAIPLDQNTVDREPTLFVYSDEMSWFDFGDDHPFKPERAAKTYDLCTRYGAMNHPWMKIVEPAALPINLLSLFHESDYLHLLQEAREDKVTPEMIAHGLGTLDNPIINGIYEWSLLAAGGTLGAMDCLAKEEALSAFNPLGGFHHAMPDHAEGFCYINDIAIAIRYALGREPDLKIAYIDLDAHHGNGVQHAFYNDPRVFVISLHETGRTLYPWAGYENETGEGDGKGFTVNFPLEPGSDDEVYEFALQETVLPLAKSFSPDLIVAVIGADTMVSDPLTHLKLTNNSYQKAVQEIMAICPRILALGGGGYDLYRTARCWTLAWSILNRVAPEDEFAGLVGGMMFGPEKEVGSLYDHPYHTEGEAKEKAIKEARRVAAFIRKEIFPTHGI